jgi:hypothetical protein
MHLKTVNGNIAKPLAEQYGQYCYCDSDTSLDTQMSVLPTATMGDGSCVTNCASVGYKQAGRHEGMQAHRHRHRHTQVRACTHAHAHTHTQKQMQFNWLTAFSSIHMQSVQSYQLSHNMHTLGHRKKPLLS